MSRLNMSEGTDGIAHSIHVADETEGGELENFREFENVVDVMNLPDGKVKFNYENGTKLIKRGRIVRSTVRGLNDAVRYRCGYCEKPETDLIGVDRGESITSDCQFCGEDETFERLGVDDI